MITARPVAELNALRMEGVVVAVDSEGMMLEVCDKVRNRTYHLFTPYGMMPPELRQQIKVGLIVRVQSWHEPEIEGRMFISMSAAIKASKGNADKAGK